MSILGGVEKIHNNLNTYTTEDIKVFKFSISEWEAIINDDDYSLLQPIRDWRALGKSPIIEIPAGVLGMSGRRSVGFIYLHLIVVSQSSEFTILGFQTMGENVVCAASIACQGTNVIDFDVHTENLPTISGNTVDGELLTINGNELITSGINVSDLENVIALPIDIPVSAAELAPVAADLFDYFQEHNGVGYPLINVNGKLYEYSSWSVDDDIITLEYVSTEVEEGYLYRIDHVDKIRKYKFIYTDGEFTRVETDGSWYFGGEIANGCPLWVVNTSSEASVTAATFGDMARFLNEFGISKSMGIVYDGWYYLKIHTYTTDGNYRRVTFIKLYPTTSNYNSGYSRTYRPVIYLYFTYDSETGYTYDHYDDSYIIVESPQVLAINVNYATPYTPQYDGSPATKKYVDDSVSGAISAGTTAPSNPTEGQIWYDTTNDVVKVYDGTNWVEVGKEYSAGKGISIGDVTINGRKGPSPDGFHVPSVTEWMGLKNIMSGLSLTTGNNWKTNLHMPFAGGRDFLNASLSYQGSRGLYWSSSPSSAGSNYARYLYLNSSNVGGADYNYHRADGCSVRCFKDSYVTPDSTWTVVQGTLGSAGIFWNQSEGLISITDGTTGYTMMDKNLGATTVYNDGDTLTQANMGYMYQRGNNYGFPSTGTISNTSSTQVDASNYGPSNPYSSDTFIIGSYDWSSVANDDLWGDTTGTYTLNNAISNTGVLSVNGQTGDVIINEGEASSIATTQPSNPVEGDIYYDTTNDVVKVYDGTNWNVVGDDAADINTKTFYLSSTSDLTNAQAALDWYLAGKNPIIIYSNRAFHVRSKSTTVLSLASLTLPSSGNSYNSIYNQTINIVYSNNTATSINYDNTNIDASTFLSTSTNYSTPYTPEYDGSPATKKYVDDNAGIQNDTTGTTSTISQEWVGTKTEFNALSSYGNKIYNIIE